MSWYTWTTGEMVFSRATYNDKWQVEEEIQENKDIINICKEKIAMLASSDPRTLLNCEDCAGHEMDPIDVLQCRLRGIFEDLEEAMYNNWRLNFLLENWDARDGDFVINPKLPKIEEVESDPNQLELIFDPELQKLHDQVLVNLEKTKPILK